jgi:hypothetical protein
VVFNSKEATERSIAGNHVWLMTLATAAGGPRSRFCTASFSGIRLAVRLYSW